MRVEFTIPGRLPGLNEYIDAERTNRFKAAEMKRTAQETVMWCIRQQLRGVHFTTAVTMHYRWIEKNRRRDLDNISSFGRKVIQDSLVKLGVLDNDGWKNIRRFTDEFDVDRNYPRIVVVISDEI